MRSLPDYRVIRVAVAAVVLVALAASAAGATGRTALTITIWPDERKQTAQRYRLACAPARGTLPRAAVACARLAAGGPALFRPPAFGPGASRSTAARSERS